jgi:ABC-type glycerol-3-phosphate transport system substrate-binding protein
VAAAFIKYLLSPEVQMAYYEGTGMMPISRNIWDTEEALQGDAQQQVLTSSSAEYVKNPQMGPRWLLTSDFIMAGLQEIWAGADVQETLDRVAANVATVGQ